MQARVASLFVFPVKACAALPVQELVFTADGRLQGDREWAVVDAGSQVTWQGEYPRLACVMPSFDGSTLVLQASGEETVRLPREGGEAPLRICIWNDAMQRTEHFDALDAGPAAAALLRRVTGADLRLVRLGAEALARSGTNALHLLSQASLDELDEALHARGLAAAEARRFRPNLVLEGDDLAPFLEEHLTRLRWSGGELRATSRCVRCIVPNVDPRDGALGAEPGPTVAALSTMRWPGAPSTLGLYARPVGVGVLARGTLLDLELAL